MTSTSMITSSSELQLQDGVYGNLDQRRNALRADIRQVSYISVNDFVSGTLPQSYKAKFPNLDDITKQLRTVGALHTTDDYWTGFPRNPSSSASTEVKVYGHLETVVRSIFDAAKAKISSQYSAPSLVEYVNNGSMTPESSERTNSSRPDGYFVLRNRPKPVGADPRQVRWRDIAVLAEFKKAKGSAAVMDNVDKLLWGLQHVLCEDPCRDFVHGFTIEDTSMKMWYCDRSNTVVSDEFDVHKDYQFFLTFCLSMLFASQSELGWDQSIRRLEPEVPNSNSAAQEKEEGAEEPRTGGSNKDTKGSQKPGDSAKPTKTQNENQPDVSPQSADRYIIDVRVDEQITRQFVTTSAISLRGADGILGRGTRVWKARELLPTGEESEDTVVIKDYWIDDDRPREGDVYASIINGAPDDATREAVKNHIIEVLCHGDVYRERVTVTAMPNAAPNAVPILRTTLQRNSTLDLGEAIKSKRRIIPLFEPKVPEEKLSHQQQLELGTPTPVTPSAYINAPRAANRPLPGVRTRNRLVIKQVGTSLLSTNSLGTIFKALRDVCQGLELVHRCGWMHRDMSSGNILLYEGRGILADFEYAKRIPTANEVRASPSSHADRTGTPYFMPIEVQAGAYLFRPIRTGVTPRYTNAATPGEAKNPKKRVRGRYSTTGTGADAEEYPGQSKEPDAGLDSTKGDVPGDSSGRRKSSPFSYNPAHDFEALLWIALYFILDRMVIESKEKQPLANLKAQEKYARRLFSGESALVPRQAIYLGLSEENTSTLEDHIPRLHPSVHAIAREVVEMMKMLKSIYCDMQKRDIAEIPSSPEALFCGINLTGYFDNIVGMLNTSDVRIKTLQVPRDTATTPSTGAQDKPVQVQASADNSELTRPAQKKTRKMQ